MTGVGMQARFPRNSRPLNHGRRLAVALCAFLPAAALADEAAPSRVHTAAPGSEFAYHDIHYSPAVRVGDLVILSGIPAVGGKTYEDKVRWMFNEMKRQLELAGASMADVVELTSFHAEARDTAGFQAELDRLLPIHAEFFGGHYPAWTAVGTTALLAPGAPLEMRAMAVIGSGKNPRADIPKPAPRPATPPAP
jgi:enamine deaminase RidA (YjgF/YER057c/UK114 family)